MKGIAGWTALALLGLVLAAGVGLAARDLSSQDVGLSAEPITVGDDLAPAATKRKRTKTTKTTKKTEATKPTQTERAPTPTQERPAAPVIPVPSDDGIEQPEAGDDSSGTGSGGGSGRGDDDD